ncbi:MAG: hypothetical protein L3J20_06900 [Flavobacteriaceae bacterium]|nr:hypothetical protein [Flavobacteriaceae bacterium]
MYFYLILALQAYCIYHSIKNRNDYYWIFIIFFIPVIGSLIYLITQVFNKRGLETVQDNLVAIINPTKKVIDLKKQLEFSETFQNKVNLADAYFEISDYKNAIIYYTDALDSLFSRDTYVISKLMEASYYVEDYKSVTTYYQDLIGKNEKIKPENQLIYGLTLDKLGKTTLAEGELKKIDIEYSNYSERLQLAEYLIQQNRKEVAKKILDKIYDESKHFTKNQHKFYRKVNTLLKSV